ncbi:nitrate reductase [Enterobacter cancerogenus]|uniref:Nitrate reductase n=1 Tax=Enterobacter cancerogenus TaxID=69218 RepID=A0A484Z683_9ENTR|nr:nitrate reductase [Enterobacter cancerogenus]
MNALVAGRCDPLSGQPESKQTAVRIAPWQPAWQGELYAREMPALPPFVHGWRKATRLTVAGDKPLLAWAIDYSTAQGWQVQIARAGERGSVLAWHDGR